MWDISQGRKEGRKTLVEATEGCVFLPVCQSVRSRCAFPHCTASPGQSEEPRRGVKMCPTGRQSLHVCLRLCVCERHLHAGLVKLTKMYIFTHLRRIESGHVTQRLQAGLRDVCFYLWMTANKSWVVRGWPGAGSCSAETLPNTSSGGEREGGK